jgi:hypothetical protein
LLLAVLGTFAGVKTAMPGLIKAVSASEQPSGQSPDLPTGSSSAPSTTDALQAVAGAFGGNALALIGAIVLGLMAQGISFGRRDLLQRLELASETLYKGVRVRSANPLESAVHALDRTAREFKESNGALLGLESQMQQLGEQLRTSFAGLEDRLSDLVNRHETDLYDRTSETLQAVHNKMGDLTDAVAASARTYIGISEALALRAEESRRAIAEMRESNIALTRALTDVVA